MGTGGFKRKLAAIFSADVVGYSRLMDDNEEATVRTLNSYRNAMTDLIQQYRGRVVDSPGDNMLAEFTSVVDAVSCAVEIQRDLSEKNAELPYNRRMKFRIGINLGDVIEEEGRIYGDGINIAARVESMAEAGGICISGRAYDQVENKLEFEYVYTGEHKVKNIRRPIQVYQIINQSNLIERFVERGGALPFPDKPSIAILPFNHMTCDPDQQYFSDGITEDIITALSRSPWLFVISRNSSFAYRGKLVDIRQISRELGARYILEGSVRKAGDRVRVTVQLIDGVVGSHVWAENYDGELKDIFDLQDQITQQVVASLLTQIQLSLGENLRQLERPDIATWDLLARGWKLFYELTNESLAEAEKLFRRAVASTPTSCDAHHLLAATIIHRTVMGYIADVEAAISESYDLAKRAILLEERNEYAHWILGYIQLMRRNHELAVAELKRAIELNPNCSLAFGSLGTVLSYSGEPDESIKNNEIAIRLNPRDVSLFFRYSGLAMAHFVSGRYPEAVKWARKCILRKTNWRIGHAVLAASLSHLNLLEEAKEAVNNYIENIPDETISKLRLLPFKNHDDARLFEEGLRRAGLPD